LDRNLSESEIAEIESRVNQVIEMKLDVSESFINRSEGEKLFNLSRLPDEAGDSLRIISIGNYDACPCSGVHISNTEEIGKFKIISSSCDNGFLRIRFKLDPCSN
jgi:alanyl-tRNA synthetase